MAKILILQGIPASGKSTFAREFLKEHPDYIRVNRDDIRRMLGDYWKPDRETFVSSCEYAIILNAMDYGYNIIVDDTNLNPKTISKWKATAEYKNYDIEFKRFHISLDEALERDKNREHPVGEEVVKRFYYKYENI